MDTSTQTSMGRSRFGGSQATLLASSFGIGVLVSLGLAALAYFSRVHANPAFFASVLFLLSVLPASAFAWLFLVDRTSIRGATRNPEQSIESARMNKATSDAFTVVCVVAGLTAVISTIWPRSVDLSLAAAICCAVALGSLALSYLVRSLRG